jgi:hypothetical protein
MDGPTRRDAIHARGAGLLQPSPVLSGRTPDCRGNPRRS